MNIVCFRYYLQVTDQIYSICNCCMPYLWDLQWYNTDCCLAKIRGAERTYRAFSGYFKCYVDMTVDQLMLIDLTELLIMVWVTYKLLLFTHWPRPDVITTPTIHITEMWTCMSIWLREHHRFKWWGLESTQCWLVETNQLGRYKYSGGDSQNWMQWGWYQSQGLHCWQMVSSLWLKEYIRLFYAEKPQMVHWCPMIQPSTEGTKVGKR